MCSSSRTWPPLPTCLTHVTQVRQQKWFFFDDEVVCLGSDITSTATGQVLTTVNQCLTHGEEVLVESKGKPTSLNAESSLNGPASWVLHRGVGYLFPKTLIILMQTISSHGRYLLLT